MTDYMPASDDDLSQWDPVIYIAKGPAPEILLEQCKRANALAQAVENYRAACNDTHDGDSSSQIIFEMNLAHEQLLEMLKAYRGES